MIARGRELAALALKLCTKYISQNPLLASTFTRRSSPFHHFVQTHRHIRIMNRIKAESPAAPPSPYNDPFCTNIIEEVEPRMEFDSENTLALGQPTYSDRLEVVSKVEAILESVVDSLLQKQKKIHIPINVKKQPLRPGIGSSSRGISASAWTRIFVNFPGRNSHEALRFGRCS